MGPVRLTLPLGPQPLEFQSLPPKRQTEPMEISQATAAFSARSQRLLLAQGATYESPIGEADWTRIPVLMRLPPPAERPALRVGQMSLPPLPEGGWLLLPWDAPQPELLEQTLEGMRQQLGALPNYVLLVTNLGHVSEGWLARLSQHFGVEFVALQVALGEVAGPDVLARPLSVVFFEETTQLIEHINPLEHLSHLADPRNPAIFIERLRRATPRTQATRTLMGLNIAIFVIMLLSTGFDLFGGFTGQQLVDWGANVSGLTVDRGAWWRMLSCTFVHANLLHIAMNMWALKALGGDAERLFGSRAFVAVYLLAGLGGSVASLAFTLADNPMMPSIGASGAVFGIMGGLVGFMVSRRGSVPRALYKSMITNAVSFTGLNLMIGLSIPSIDNAAHMGGLVTGIVAGALLSRDLPPAPQPSGGQRLIGVAVVLGALALALSAL